MRQRIHKGALNSKLQKRFTFGARNRIIYKDIYKYINLTKHGLGQCVMRESMESAQYSAFVLVPNSFPFLSLTIINSYAYIHIYTRMHMHVL